MGRNLDLWSNALFGISKLSALINILIGRVVGLNISLLIYDCPFSTHDSVDTHFCGNIWTEASTGKGPLQLLRSTWIIQVPFPFQLSRSSNYIKSYLDLCQIRLSWKYRTFRKRVGVVTRYCGAKDTISAEIDDNRRWRDYVSRMRWRKWKCVE